MEQYGQYKVLILENRIKTGWFYKIFVETDTILRESKELFLTEGIARFAAIGHIGLLEQGKG